MLVNFVETKKPIWIMDTESTVNIMYVFYALKI